MSGLQFKVPKLGGSYKHDCIVSHFWRLKVLNQGADRVVSFWRAVRDGSVQGLS